MRKIIFVSGGHGVGKGTLCKQLQSHYNCRIYSCSDLIKKYSNYVEAGKEVSSAERNQLALQSALRDLPNENILLDGHFCLLSTEGGVIELNDDVFDAINPEKIINVICDEQIIYQRLLERDGKAIDIQTLKLLQESEYNRALIYSGKKGTPIYTIVSGDDLSELLKWLMK